MALSIFIKTNHVCRAHRVPFALLAVAVVSMAGCSMAHEDLPIVSGLYSLRVKGQNGSCSNFKEMEQSGIAVLSDAEWLNLETVHPKRMSIRSNASTEFQMTMACQNNSAHGSTVKQATVTRTFLTPKETDTGFEIQYQERWFGDEGCMMPLGTANKPIELGCTEHGTLQYTLEESCPTPCELTFSQSRASCSCS